MDAKNFIVLLGKFRDATLDENERTMFLTAVRSGRFDEVIAESFGQDMELGWYAVKDDDVRMQQDWNWLTERINAQTAVALIAPAHRVHFLKTAWSRVAVAILIILTGVLVYTSFFHASDTGKEMVKAPSPQPEILPGGNRAMLTLADGSQIILDSAAIGKLAQQSGATIQKSGNGEIIYAFDKATVNKSVGYNTMSTPRGGQYRLILPDGSKVWLNAESSVTFPTAFTGNTREITMTGEAYFEIKADKQKPFIVKTNSDEIQVLGTSFNINAYRDAPVKTSLLQGIVKVKTTILKPGQAFIDGKITTTNLEQDMAWKNNLFDFNEIPLKQAMQQLARWYDVEIKYEGKIPDIRLWGEMGRQLTLNEVLKGLKTVGINARLENRILKIYP